MTANQKDEFYIKRTLELAANGRGFTSPNPHVGCVIVKNGHVISEGYHKKFGDKHAEADAIDSASEPVSGATLYCNLEPCCHGIPNKKTPPCSQRIIDEKIKRVVIAAKDANPYVNGRGIRELLDAGIEVSVGILEEDARELNEAYYKFMKTGQPFVHVKIAQSVDGRIATHIGDSKWITNDAALTQVHEMRYSADGIVVGLNTVIQDNPYLTQRLFPEKQPFRIVLDEKLAIPLDVNLLTDKFSRKTIVVTTENHDPGVRKSIEKTGARVCVVPAGDSGYIDLSTFLKKMAEMNIIHILVEGGSKVFTSFVKEKLADKITIFQAPKFIGTGIPAIDQLGISRLAESIVYRTHSIENVAGQVKWVLYPEG